jgi:integrase/recombinase XerD
VGARISDVKDISAKNIVGDELVYSPVKLRRRKPKIVRVPLHEMAKQFIERGGGVFNRVYADVYINRLLKKVGIAAGITTVLSTHVARHTFATIFLERGGKVEVLQQLMGHANIKDTMKYVHVAESRKAEQIKVFDGFMN